MVLFQKLSQSKTTDFFPSARTTFVRWRQGSYLPRSESEFPSAGDAIDPGIEFNLVETIKIRSFMDPSFVLERI